MCITGGLMTRERIAATEQQLRPYIRRTPVLTASRADFGLGQGPLHFKMES